MKLRKLTEKKRTYNVWPDLAGAGIGGACHVPADHLNLPINLLKLIYGNIPITMSLRITKGLK